MGDFVSRGDVIVSKLGLSAGACFSPLVTGRLVGVLLLG